MVLLLLCTFKLFNQTEFNDKDAGGRLAPIIYENKPNLKVKMHPFAQLIY